MNSAKTQITRKNVSAPMRWIVNNLYFSPFEDVLHFGEGKAFADTEALRLPPYGSGPYVMAFDPNSPHVWKRDRQIINPEFYTYAHGVSIYVFNTLLPKDRDEAFYDMLACCNRCYIAVRTDRVPGHPHPLTPGVITQRGTFQTQLNAEQWQAWFLRVSPEWASVSLLHNGGHFCIIEVSR